jgi:alkylation response protein AidB-like acyl-CoA dehydrogenase
LRFELSDDQELLRRSTRELLTREVPFEKSRRVMETSPLGHDPGAWRSLAELGYLGLTLPPAVGGQGLGAVELAVVLEEMGRACLPGPYLDVVLGATLLAAAGGEDARLARIAGGEELVTIAREDAPFAGGHEPAARLEGGRVRGQKVFVPFAAQADALLVVTPQGIALAAAPFAVAPLPTFDLTQRFGAVAFDHAATLLGSPALLDPVDHLAAMGAAALLLGVMSHELEATLAYVQAREAFRRPIGAFQALQHRLADMLLRTESTRSAVYRAAWCLDARDPDAPLACAAAKVYAGDAARLVCGEAIQMHGGIGFTWEVDRHFYFKRAKTLEQHYGAPEVQLERALSFFDPRPCLGSGRSESEAR